VRNADATRLAGWRYDATGVSVEEAIRILGTFIAREGGKSTHVFVNPRNWHRLMNEGAAKSIITTGPTGQNGKLVVGYDAIQVVTAAGTVKVIPGANVPSTQLYMLNMEDWCLLSLDEVPFVVNDDGNDFLRLSTDNTFEYRCGYDATLICYNPGSQGVATISAPSI
jgi:hypothetical protein